MNKKYSYDKKADAIYITLSDKPVAYTKPLDDTRIIDYDNKDMPVGIELLCVSEGVIVEGLPSLTEVTPVLEKERVKAFA
jgi:uncharacterized protein YuzE